MVLGTHNWKTLHCIGKRGMIRTSVFFCFFLLFVTLLTPNGCRCLQTEREKKSSHLSGFLSCSQRSPANLHFKPFNQALCTASRPSQKNSTGQETSGRGAHARAHARAHKAIFDDERALWGNFIKLCGAPCGARPGESQTAQSTSSFAFLIPYKETPPLPLIPFRKGASQKKKKKKKKSLWIRNPSTPPRPIGPPLGSQPIRFLSLAPALFQPSKNCRLTLLRRIF